MINLNVTKWLKSLNINNYYTTLKYFKTHSQEEVKSLAFTAVYGQ